MTIKFGLHAEFLPSVWSLDETLEPYYGQHQMQTILKKGKPTRFGFEFWCLNEPCENCVCFRNYKVCEHRGPGITLRSAETKVLGFVPECCEIFLDNYFNSLPRLEQMKINKHEDDRWFTAHSYRIV